MSPKVTLAHAKTTFSECIRQAEHGQSVVITRHGKPVAALVSPEDLEVIKTWIALIVRSDNGRARFTIAVYTFRQASPVISLRRIAPRWSRM